MSRFRRAYKRGRGGGGNSLYPRGLKNASKQAIAVLIKKRFAFTGFKTEVNVLRKGTR